MINSARRANRAVRRHFRLLRCASIGDPFGVARPRIHNPTDPPVLRRIYEIRSAVRRTDARPNDGRCGNVSAALEKEFGWQRQSGYLRLRDGTVCWLHCWNRLTDGTIVDATADQFQNLWLDDVVILDPAHPMAANYRPSPGDWDIRFDRARTAATCVCGDDVRLVSADDSARPWFSLARAVLVALTGWELADELVEMAARTLRAKASMADHISSGEVTHPLLIWSIQHLGKQSAPPWIATEFRDPI